MGVTGRVTEPCHPQGDRAVAPLEPPLNPPREPSQQPPAPDLPRLVHPDRLSSADRAALEVLLQGFDAPAAQMLLDELAGALETPNTIKTTPTRWFRALAERMRQGRFVPTAGVHVAERRVIEMARRAEREKGAAEAATRSPMTPEERAVVRQRLSDLRVSLTKPKEHSLSEQSPTRR